MKFILSMTVVLAVGLGILTACQKKVSQVKTETAKTNTNSAVNSTQKVDEQKQTDDAPRITLEEAKKDFDAGNAVFVDSRAEVQYKQERIKGAISIPAEAIETRWKEIPTDKKIIVYCS